MEEERLAVLRMLQEGKITVEEAAALLEALAEGSSPSKDATVEPGPTGGPEAKEKMVEPGDKAEPEIKVEPGNKVEEKLRRVKDLARSGVIEENVLSAVENVLRTVSERIDEAFDSAWEGGPGIFAMWPHKRVERTFTGDFSATGEVSVSLEIKNGRISLVPWDNEGFQVRAVGFVRGHQSHRAEAEFERLIGYIAGPGSLKIEATNMRAIAALSLEISLPRRLTYKISAETTNGSIATGEFACSEISLESTNGGIRVHLPRDPELGVSVETETHFGVIRIEYPDMNITKEYRSIGNHEIKAVSQGYETASRKLDLDLETAHGSIVVANF